MIARAVGLLALLMSTMAAAQTMPSPSLDDPRLQTVTWEPNQTIRLVAFPDADLKLTFTPAEIIERVVLSDGAAFRANVVGRSDTIEITPLRAGANATMKVSTNQHSYEFALETGTSLSAAYVVRLVPPPQLASQGISKPQAGAQLIHYRVSGTRAIRPDSIYDDGDKTFIKWGRYLALPAVFGIGPGGGEEIVAGYMRDGVFVIDRIYPALVFRFDKEVAYAKRKAK